MSEPSSKVHRARLHEQVARNLSLSIIRKELEPGSLLPNEDELCQQFDVSRTVIREAIRIMDARGLVEVRPRIGTRICPPSRWALTDPTLLHWQLESAPDFRLIQNLYELRNMIEPMVAKLTTQRASDEEIAEICQVFEEMKNARTLEEHIQADLKLHLAILDACGNKLVRSPLRPLIENTLGSSFRLFIRSLDKAKQSLPLHEAVVEAIRTRKPEEAANAMRAMVTSSAEDVRKLEIEFNKNHE